jgi:hypothetical protein
MANEVSPQGAERRPVFPGAEESPGTHRLSVAWHPSGIWLTAKLEDPWSGDGDAAALITARHAAVVLTELAAALAAELAQYPGEGAGLEATFDALAAAVERLRSKAS